jgi:PAS domain S-box-containing protein
MDIDLIGAIVFELDSEGRVTELNQAAKSFFGASIGMSFFETFVPHPDRREAHSAFQRALRGKLGARDLVEMAVEDARHETHLLLWRLNVREERVVYAGMDLPDVLDRAHARSLKELANVKHALDASTIVAITDVEGTITFVNDKFCEISKYSREELLGQNHRIVSSGHHPKEFFKEMWATIGHGKIWQGDIKNRAKDGSYYWVSTTIVPFLDDRGRPQQYVALRHEITERKNAEAALVEANRRIREEQLKLIQAEKLSSIGLLAAGIAHEVNNPLTGVLGCVKALREKKDMSEERREEYSRTALEGLERIQQTMRGLLDFARERPTSATSMDVADVVTSALRLIAPALRKKDLKIERAIEPVDLKAHADRGQVLQALVNVLLNAVYASPESASIRISAGEKEGRVRIGVKDVGPGIPPEVIGKVCDPFFSTKPEGEGTGLGLSVTLGLLKANAGDLEIESEVGSGARVTLVLPHARLGADHARSPVD